MKLVYHSVITGRKHVRDYDSWASLLDAVWRQYRLARPLYLLDVAADAAWQAMEDVLP